MQQLRPAIPPQLNSLQVLFRAVLRLVLLTAFAAFGSRGFGQTFASLLALAAIFCAIVAVMRGEAIFGPRSDPLGRGGNLRRLGPLGRRIGLTSQIGGAAGHRNTRSAASAMIAPHWQRLPESEAHLPRPGPPALLAAQLIGRRTANVDRRNRRRLGAVHAQRLLHHGGACHHFLAPRTFGAPGERGESGSAGCPRARRRPWAHAGRRSDRI